MRRKKLPPDDRLDWRDPNMPALRYGVVDGIEGMHEIKPEHITQYYHAKMHHPFNSAPNWKNDPTYNLKKNKNSC